ncbi:MAG: ATP-binding cassette domain-containing protein [Leptospirales bacterium]|nr:ATP-binding cassette domain-containing protein [Leptospirales bacterium]
MNKLLVFDNVSCNDYGIPALRDLSFDVERGENVVVFGPERSGIHLLCPLIAGFINITRGNISYNNVSLKTMDYIAKIKHKQKIGYLQYDYGLISNMSVEQNISLPLQYHSKMSSAEIAEYVAGIIAELDLKKCKDRRPFTLNRAETFKTAYARATIFDPDLLMIEHAFEGQSLIELLPLFDILTKRNKQKEKSTLFITFEPHNFVKVAHKFMMFFNNEVVFSGGPDDFLNSDNPYLRQYRNMSWDGPMSFS